MGKLLGAVICAILFVCSANAVELSVLDFDGTIFEIKKFDKNTPGIYDTKVILYRIENRPNLMIDMPKDLPREIEVSSLDMKHKLTRINEVTDKEESILSPKDGHIGSLSEVTLSDGKKIIPGLYRIESPGSFKYFREGPAGQNYILETIKLGVELERSGLGTFKGKFFGHLQNMASTRESADSLIILTARGHSRAEWMEALQYLKDAGYLKFLPKAENIHSINRPEYEKYGLGDEDSVRKVGVLREIVQELTRAKLNETDNRLHPNGVDTGKFHSISFADDNQKTLELAYESLRNFSMRRWNVKIILSNSGQDFEVKRSRKPRSFVITDMGTVRPATDFETAGEPIHQNKFKLVGAKDPVVLEKNLVKTCAGLF